MCTAVADNCTGTLQTNGCLSLTQSFSHIISFASISIVLFFPASSSAAGSGCFIVPLTDISYGRLLLLPKNAQLTLPHMSWNTLERDAFPRYDRQTLDGAKITLRRRERMKKKAWPCQVAMRAEPSRVTTGVAWQCSWEAITGPFKYRFSKITSH